MPRKDHVYMVQRRDYVISTDDGTTSEGALGGLEIVDNCVYVSLQQANEAALQHFNELEDSILGDSPLEDSELKDLKNKGHGRCADGRLYKATCYTIGGGKGYDVEVLEMELKKTAASPASSAAGSKASTQPPKSTSISQGDQGRILNGLRVMFTGTFEMTREECTAIAKKHGATVQKKLGEDTDLVFLGARAGPNKLKDISMLGLDTADEEGFLEMVRNSEAEASSGPASKKQRR